MQRFISLSASRTACYTGRLQSFNRRNGSISNPEVKKSLLQSLEDIKQYFNDISINSRIETVKKIVPSSNCLNFEPTTITLGIVQSKDIKPGLFIDSLIVDPLSSDNKTDAVIKQFRKANPNSNIKILYGTKNETVKGGIFKSKSPILNHESRLIQDAKLGDGSGKLLNRDIFNDLSFIEVNDKSFSQQMKIEGADNLDLDTVPKDDHIAESDCQLWVYVTSSSGNIEKLNDSPYFSIINISSESQIGGKLVESLKPNSFEVDLEKLNDANKLIAKSINNVSTYLELYQQSNMNELLYTLNRETSGYKPLILLLRGLLRDLHIKESDDVKTAKKLKQEITEWAQNSHFELQSKVTPFLDNVLLKKLTNMNQLIINSGDLTLLISNYLNGNRVKLKNGLFDKDIECYGTLEDSIAKSHYLEGRIDALFPENKNNMTISENGVDYYLSGLKSDISNVKLPELQAQINNFLTKEVIAVPFTIFLLTNIGYVYDIITLNTLFAVTALSIAVTANISQKKAVSLISEFKDWYLEKLRIYIDKTMIFLGKRLNDNIIAYEVSQAKKRELISELKSAIVELEKADEILKKSSNIALSKK
ncbi:hypothetical protein C6P40_001001 [Pichia californica]|uniref:Mmc1 C-terminal domain-containing protein n=1 Tax=Pichia californica TaxID=460514 RepID=A0A9P6WJV3_9ASCO|nr:hypothetical protein C6P42_000930 [[Candida] californica]KAG0688420.1 hypothetical protein C6P40_001001 [[Candida] californica]